MSAPHLPPSDARDDDAPSSFEGRTLDKPRPELHFQRVAQPTASRGTEQSLVFVGAGALTEVLEHDEVSGSWSSALVKVDLVDDDAARVQAVPDDVRDVPQHDTQNVLDADENEPLTLAPVAPLSNSASAMTAACAAGGHWLAPLRTLPEADARISIEWTSTLPVLTLGRSHSSDGLASRIAGRSAAGRAVRIGLAAAAVFSVVAVRDLADHPSASEVTSRPSPDLARVEAPASPVPAVPAVPVSAAPASEALTFEALAIVPAPAPPAPPPAPSAHPATSSGPRPGAPTPEKGAAPAFGAPPTTPGPTEMARL